MDATTSLVKATYEAFMDLRTGKTTPDQARERLAALKEQAGAQWNAVKFRAMAYDAKHNVA